MIATDENALICDFAETYHIYDYKSLPPSRAAIFACGLKNDSRIKMKIAGMKYSLETLMLASMVDRLSLLVWAKTQDGPKGLNRPESIMEKLLQNEKEKDIVSFDSGEDFRKKREEILGKGGQ